MRPKVAVTALGDTVMSDRKLYEEIWRRPRVIAATGMGKTWIHAAIASGDFPPSVKLGSRSVGWKKSDVLAWIDGRESNGKG
jgi:prophage regulatory protein